DVCSSDLGALATRACSASRTAASSGMRPSSSQYTPTPRLTFAVRLSALKASVRPRIGSRGAISTVANIDWLMAVGQVLDFCGGSVLKMGCTAQLSCRTLDFQGPRGDNYGLPERPVKALRRLILTPCGGPSTGSVNVRSGRCAALVLRSKTGAELALQAIPKLDECSTPTSASDRKSVGEGRGASSGRRLSHNG